jgi:hypothetical protein
MSGLVIRISAAMMLIASFFMSSSAPALAQFKQQSLKLVGIGTAGNAEQGWSVALSGDGNTAIVGGPFDNSNAGAAWVFVRTNGVWKRQGRKLVGSGAVGPAAQGISVALSDDGNTAIVGGRFDNSNVGAAWVFVRNRNGVWRQQGPKLVGTGGISANIEQGYSVALSADGNTAIIGGAFDNSGVGAAWVFVRTKNVWTQQGHKLVGAGANAPSLQGGSVALSNDGNTAIVGGSFDNSQLGAAWVFVRRNGVWRRQGPKLVGTGAVGVAAEGASVALSDDGNTAIVGGPADDSSIGAAWTFVRTNRVWTQQGAKLIGGSAVGAGNQGNSVALSGDGNTAVVGGPSDDSDAGAAWVFVRKSGVWNQQGQKRVGTGAAGVASQGYSVALSGDGNTAISGGPGDNAAVGAAWVFVAAPAITRVRPASGRTAGNTAVTIKGRNLAGATSVKFGVRPATSFTVTDATTIVAHTPRHPAGKVAVTVTTSAGRVQKAAAFTYQ